MPPEVNKLGFANAPPSKQSLKTLREAAGEPTSSPSLLVNSNNRRDVLTLDELVEKSRHDAIVGLQRWYGAGVRDNQTVLELRLTIGRETGYAGGNGTMATRSA